MLGFVVHPRDFCRRPAAIIQIMALLFCGLTACVNDSDPSDAWALRAGDSLPNFEVSMADGQTISSESLRGKLSVVTLFDTSCGDCQRELPQIDMAYRQAGDRAVFIAISRAERAASVARYWETGGLTIPYSAQDDRRVYDLFASAGIPRVYISNASLTIIAAFGPDDAPDANKIVNIINSYDQQ